MEPAAASRGLQHARGTFSPRTVKELMISTHVLGLGASGVRSPLGRALDGEGFFAVSERRISSYDNRPRAATSSHLACYDPFHREPFAPYPSPRGIRGRSGRGSMTTYPTHRQ